jgi:hypothetical protein
MPTVSDSSGKTLHMRLDARSDINGSSVQLDASLHFFAEAGPILSIAERNDGNLHIDDAEERSSQVALIDVGRYSGQCQCTGVWSTMKT